MLTKPDPDLIQALNDPQAARRLDALRQLSLSVGRREKLPGRDVNNHIHTQYSFSPYSPAKAVWMAFQAGLATAGIMDHDTIAGAREFIEAGRIMGLPVTVGAECRVSFAATALAGRRINNPDQDTVAYVALHGVPHSQIDALSDWFRPILAARGTRNRAMTARLNQLLEPAGICLDYDRDIVPLSAFAEGGQVTERHLLFAVAQSLLARFGAGTELVAFLKNTLAIPVREKARLQLEDQANPHLAYDLLGVLKSDLVEAFYIDASDECPPVAELAAFAQAHGIILAYAYLGDVTESVTGDKKAQAFEDGYLDELFVLLKEIGFKAITYMPSRNTREQLVRVRALCDRHGFFQISGEDINQPRQPFICEAMRDPFFANLYDAAWALIGHERLATQSLDRGFFAPETVGDYPDLAGRVQAYRDQALALYGYEPAR